MFFWSVLLYITSNRTIAGSGHLQVYNTIIIEMW